jgi:hypothetical protein
VRRVVLLLCVLGCGHGEPFSSHETGVSGPFSGGTPIRLTYNIGYDIWPAWSADGTAIWYSAQDSLTPDKDHCIVRLPAAGGSYTENQCPPPYVNQLTEILQQPAVGDTMLAYARSELGTAPEHSQYRFSIWLASTTPHSASTRVMSFPYFGETGTQHDAPLDLQWLRPGVLLYLGAENGCCNKDTLRFGDQVVLLDLTGPSPVRSYVAGTIRASAVMAARDGLSIYYTFYGDSRVYQQVLASGQVTVLHDFGAGHIVRDPDVAGSRLAATIDGQPGFRDTPPFGPVQIDHGGHLVVVDLTSGNETVLPDDDRLYKRPRLSPAGDRLVAEGYPYQLNPVRDSLGVIVAYDTVVSKWDDLWLLEE